MTKQTKLKLRKGFHKAPPTYRVLAVNQLSKEDLKIVTKTMIKINTEAQAKALVGIGSKWGYKPFQITDRVGVITYKGIEVALMFKRFTTMVEPMPDDPVPEGYLENPEDVWIRYDLFGLSPRQQSKIIRTEVESQEKEANMLQIELDAKDIIIKNLETSMKSLQTQLKEKKKK